MAMIKCPECGKEISSLSTSCIHCGCPIGSRHDGVLRVQLISPFWQKNNASITINFEGESVQLKQGYYRDFAVPADGKNHPGTITCSHGLFDGKTYEILLKPGESKKISITFINTLFGGSDKWEYREEFFVTN